MFNFKLFYDFFDTIKKINHSKLQMKVGSIQLVMTCHLVWILTDNITY
jgi:hypothetical protein